MNPLLNPILLGLFPGVVTYTYLSWVNKQKYEKKKTKKKRKEIRIDLTIPIIISISTWLIAYLYHENCDKNKDSLSSISVDKNYSLNKNSDTERSYRMIKPGINVPRNLQDGGSDDLPDVFINAI